MKKEEEDQMLYEDVAHIMGIANKALKNSRKFTLKALENIDFALNKAKEESYCKVRGLDDLVEGFRLKFKTAEKLRKDNEDNVKNLVNLGLGLGTSVVCKCKKHCNKRPSGCKTLVVGLTKEFIKVNCDSKLEGIFFVDPSEIKIN